MGNLNRSWCARLQYPGLRPFLFGTIVVRHEAPDHEVRLELMRAVAEVLPTEPPPLLVGLTPGALFYQPEKETASA